MAVNWYLNQALTNFRKEVNAAYPKRDKASDGTIGDAAHQSRSSDHNPDPDGSVDAWDMDVDLNGVGKPYAADVERLKRLFEKHESSHYWIHNDQICFRSEGWKPKSYAYAGSGRNRHEKHVHFNTRESHERSTKPWGVTVAKENDLEKDEREALFEVRTLLREAKKVNWATTNRADALLGNKAEASYLIEGEKDRRKEPNALKAELTALRQEVGSVKQAVAAVRPAEPTVVSDEQLERVLRKVVRSLGEAA